MAQTFAEDKETLISARPSPIERVGAETFVYGSRARDEQRVAATPGELPPGEIIVRIPGTEAPAIGARIHVAAVRNKLHLFSADGRTRIEA